MTLAGDDPGDDTIESYQVLRRARDGSDYEDGLGAAEFVVVVDDTGSSPTTYTDTTVTARTRYVYRVRARNPQGLSEESGDADAETPEAPPETPTPAVPSGPTGLTASSQTHNSVALAWDNPGDDTIESYQVLRRARDGLEYGDGLGAPEFVVVVDDTGTAVTTYTDTSVTPRTRYVYRVKARNPQGLSEESGDTGAETTEAPVAPPLAVDPAPLACPAAESTPTATEVAVTDVPIVVASTTADYFVLYARHEVDGTAVEYPVQVILGEDGTTTLAENVAALPKECYRVEKYLVESPVDVDGDGTDDITELGDPAEMNPVNPAPALDDRYGTVMVPNRETFESLAYSAGSGTSYVKFVIINDDSERPTVYFQKTNQYMHHNTFMNAAGIGRRGSSTTRGEIIFHPQLVAPDGSRGVYYFTFVGRKTLSLLERTYTLLAANMPLLDDELALWIPNRQLRQAQGELPSYRASRMNLVFDEDVYGETSFQALNLGGATACCRTWTLTSVPTPATS